MKRTALLIMAAVMFCGCQTAPVVPTAPPEPLAMQKRFVSLTQLRTGLTRAEVAGLLGKEVITGYSLVDEGSGEYAPITTANPYRVEAIKNKNKTHSVEYYLIGIKVADDIVSDDELVPIVYINDRVVGIGWDYLNGHVKGQ